MSGRAPTPAKARPKHPKTTVKMTGEGYTLRKLGVLVGILLVVRPLPPRPPCLSLKRFASSLFHLVLIRSSLLAASFVCW